MNITNFVYCLNTERIQSSSDKNSGLNIIGVLHRIILDFVPGQFTFSIVFSLSHVEKNKKNIRITFKKKNGNTIFDTGHVPLPEQDAQTGKSIDLNMTLGLDIRNLIIKEKGIYETQIYIDDELIDSVPIDVIQKESDANE